MNNKDSLKQLLSDSAVMDEIRGTSRNYIETESSNFTDASARGIESLLSSTEIAVSNGSLTQLEAIVLLTGRPSLLIQDGKWETPQLNTIKSRLDKSSDALLETIPKVGRVEVINLGNYLGTGWMLDEGIMITNRHVAEVFAARIGGSFGFKSDNSGNRYQARVNFRREHERTAEHIAKISEIVFLEEPGQFRPDMALVRLDTSGGSLPTPIELDDTNPEFETDIAVIGYPAEDSRNDAFAMKRIFKGDYNVKRLSPGKVRGVDLDGKRLIHDCTTLGGNSGSVIMNLNTGKACGLHFAGSYKVNNYAVSVGWLKSRLTEINRRVWITVPQLPVEEARSPAIPNVSQRKGYNPTFLSEEMPVPLPIVSESNMVAAVKDEADGELRYTHFSIAMHKERRLPFYTACNIDGQLLYNFPRGRDRWYLDKRLIDYKNNQIGEDLYKDNPLDRGHLVRRLDPVWGENRAEAKQAEMDTFFFTNCSPQHSRLNRQAWLRLEDYVLGNAGTHDLKVSVFTGPILANGDRNYRDIQIPEEYWKVIAVQNTFTGKLSATAYLLSQAEYLTDLEFTFGEFRTYQVAITEIEEKTGLSFDKLSLYDPMNQTEGRTRRVISEASDIAY
ncbi:DNA/RNA non-specific endonuclease [Coraliomargarita sp. W4R53]